MYTLIPDIRIKEEPDSGDWQLSTDSTLNTSDLSHLRVRLVDEEDQLGQEGKRLRRVACTCPNCKESGGRWVSLTSYSAQLCIGNERVRTLTAHTCVSQRIQHGEEEAAHLPHCRLWESIWKDIAPASTPALAFRGATFCLQLDVLWEEVHTQRRAAETQENTHRCPFFCSLGVCTSGKHQ